MRKIAFLILGAVFMFGCTEKIDLPDNEMSDLQLKSAETKTYQYWNSDGYAAPLFCNDEVVDYVEGDVMSHWRWHYKDGELEFVLINWKGTLTSYFGEVLTIKETNKIYFNKGETPIYQLRWNIMGENGSHYIGMGIVDWDTWHVIPEKVVCPPSADDK